MIAVARWKMSSYQLKNTAQKNMMNRWYFEIHNTAQQQMLTSCCPLSQKIISQSKNYDSEDGENSISGVKDFYYSHAKKEEEPY